VNEFYEEKAIKDTGKQIEKVFFIALLNKRNN
jgi:hypothetical protein